MLQATHYIPIVTTVISLAFAYVLFQHWNRKRTATYLVWWAIGVLTFGIGTSTEAIKRPFRLERSEFKGLVHLWRAVWGFSTSPRHGLSAV